NLIFGTDFSGWVCSSGCVGGICGYSGYGNRIDECFTYTETGKNNIIKGTGTAVGGISGRNYGSTIDNTYNGIDVRAGNEKTYTGGIVGENMSEGRSFIPGYPAIFGIIANCYNMGNVTGGGDSSYTGGIAGYNIGGTIYNSYCAGDVNGKSGIKGGVAGINGSSEGTYTLYEGITQQQYKSCDGIVSYSYSTDNVICGTNSTVATGVNCSKLDKNTYTLDSGSLCDALNTWVKGAGLGDDEKFETYLQWRQPAGENPQFTGSHYLETQDIEPLPKYALIYNPNGDDVEGTMESVVYEMTENTTPNDKKPIVAEVGYTREGYKFAGWNTSPDGKGVSYKAGDRIDIKGTTNLYAIWTSTQVVITDVTKNNGNNVTINWNGIDDASGYWIYRQKVNEGQAARSFTDADKIGETRAGTLSYNDNNLDAGRYFYGVRAYSASGGGSSSVYTFMPFSEPKEINIVVVGITYMNNVPDSTLSDRRECIEGKEIEIIENAFSYSGYVFAGWNSEPDGSGDTYNVGESVTVTENITLYALWNLEPVTIVNAQTTSRGTVILNWNRSNVTDIAGYKVYCSVGNNSDYKLIGTVDNNDEQMLRYETESVIPSTTYYYRVTIYRNSQTASGTFSEESDYSNEVAVTSDAQIVLDNARGLMEDGHYTGINGDKVYLKWEEKDGVTGYELYRSDKEGSYGTKIGTVTVSSTVTYTDTVPGYGTFYYYMRPYTETKGTGNQIS
ncbi:MAG: InlB B-repeat-containing protein, partial [Lachnospiraceae bacterium]|nr:InlB B-repeat-containing protein [Lachnospiraceae bacterium]